eukprot:SAG25_NODE_167_length_13063_cov_9.799830_7_plen_196_part_00
MAVAPASSAAKASVGVANPGTETKPSSTVRRITSTFVFGETMSFPPASATRSTSAAVSTVPAPTTARPPTAPAISLMDSKGCGEFNGTSMRVKPALTSASPTSTACEGSIPRRMAQRGISAMAAAKASSAIVAAVWNYLLEWWWESAVVTLVRQRQEARPRRLGGLRPQPIYSIYSIYRNRRGHLQHAAVHVATS